MKFTTKMIIALTVLNLSINADVIDKKGILNISDSFFGKQSFNDSFITGERSVYNQKSCYYSDEQEFCEESESFTITTVDKDVATLNSVDVDGEYEFEISKAKWKSLNQNPVRYYMQELVVSDEINKRLQSVNEYSLTSEDTVIEIVDYNFLNVEHLGRNTQAILLKIEARYTKDDSSLIIPFTYIVAKGQTLTKSLNLARLNILDLANVTISLKQ